MKFSAKKIDNDLEVFLIRPTRFADSRGYFMESWSKDAFAQLGFHVEFVQDNESLSARRGTVRGLHFQRPPWEQAKLVRVLRGAIYDVFVDIRPKSLTFGRWRGITMSATDGEQLLVPRGYAHGFVTLSDEAIVSYKVDAPYNRESESGITWNDPELDVRWPFVYEEAILSDKDRLLPSFKEYSLSVSGG